MKRKKITLLEKLRMFLRGHDLEMLGKIYKTDKVEGHFYAPHYMRHFRKFRFRKINLLEIGVGGYHYTDRGGASLRMWKKYFPFGHIYSIDIYDKTAIEEKRITIFQGSQVDEQFLDKVVKEIGEIDIIIDDGSHMNEDVIKSFKILFPKLKDGGIYVVEDTQTSYWKEYNGDSNDLQNPFTLMNFFKQLTDGLNHQEFLIPGYEPDYFDRKITSLHFYHNLIFIYKGDNDEGSNLVVNNRMP